MKKYTMIFLLIPLVLLAHPLDSLLASRGDPIYEAVISTETQDGLEVFVLKSEGMNWEGMSWFHRVGIALPKNLRYTDRAFVLVVGGSRYVEDRYYYEKTLKDALKYSWIADLFEAPFVIIADVPNQPIWGMREDDLIAETFERFLKEPDPKLPLLVPMTYGVIRALDTVQDFLKREKGYVLKYFMVSGASKRGWTTYLTGVFDSRVFAIAPMVYDNLNIPEQLSRQIEYYGTYSEKIADYTRRGLLDAMKDNPKAQDLLEIVDPYRMRLRLSLPKFLVMGTNDRYWTVDSVNVYLDSLPGKTWIYYSPNDGHDLTRVGDLARTLSTFFKLYPDGRFPEPRFSLEEGEMCVRDEKLSRLELWYSRSKDMDFRNSIWIRLEGEKRDGKFRVKIPKRPGDVNQAYFARAVYEYEGLEYYISSRMFVERKE